MVLSVCPAQLRRAQQGYLEVRAARLLMLCASIVAVLRRIRTMPVEHLPTQRPNQTPSHLAIGHAIPATTLTQLGHLQAAFLVTQQSVTQDIIETLLPALVFKTLFVSLVQTSPCLVATLVLVCLII